MVWSGMACHYPRSNSFSTRILEMTIENEKRMRDGGGGGDGGVSGVVV